MSQTIEELVRDYETFLDDQTFNGDEKEYVHMRFVRQGDVGNYLCGRPVGPCDPVHGFWMPEDAYEHCPHCGTPICPKCFDLALTFGQLG